MQLFLIALFFVQLQAYCNIPRCQRCSNIQRDKCSKCKRGYYLSSGSTKCKYCPIECIECSSYNQCTECATGYYLSRGDCKMNSDKHKGYNCPLGTYWDNYMEMCIACSNYCQICYSYTSCSACISGYTVNKYGYCESIVGRDDSDFSEEEQEEEETTSAGEIIGIIVGVITGIAIVIGTIIKIVLSTKR